MTDPAPDPAPAPDPEPTTPPSVTDPDPAKVDDPAAEIAKWKHFAREHEKAAKANADAARKLQEIEDAAKTQAEKDADARAAAEARAVKAETDLLRHKVASTKGIPVDLADLLTGADEAEMTAVADRLLAMKGTTPPAPSGGADGGPQGAPVHKVPQLTRADLSTLTPEQIVDAKAKGQLNDLLGTS